MEEHPPQPGFASRQDTPEIARRIQRRVMGALPRLRRGRQAVRELIRRVRKNRHAVDFFHQVGDPYSHLALEAIPKLQARYDIDFRFHLVGQTDRLHAPEPDMLGDYARRDCGWVAPHYGLVFPKDPPQPADAKVRQVEALLTATSEPHHFLKTALEAGRALWQNDPDALARLAAGQQSATETHISQTLEAGNALRKKRRHYSGGMFWYAGEWYWGVDRLHHLERRLTRYGALTADSPDHHPTLCFDRPAIDPGPLRNRGQLSLDFFPSLRSPYTAMIFDRSIALAAETGIPIKLRPVMPMVMRGVPAPAAKGIYIFLDTEREAKHLGVPFGDMYDPIGRPVERGFSLWPFARDQGRGAEFLSSFLRAAFIEGREIGSDEGLQRVVEEAGLDFNEARGDLDGDGWREEIEANRELLYDELGVWGVPSYRLCGPEGEPDLCVWGQDRLWLVAAEIKRRLAL